MRSCRRKRLSVADSQVLFWLYEYTVKHGLSQLSSRIEQIFAAEQTQPVFQGSKSLMICVRHLQKHFGKGLGKETLRDLQFRIKDILKNQQFQEFTYIYSILIKLYFTSKLLMLNNQELNHDAVLKEIPYFNWNQLKHDFQLNNDNFKGQFKTCILSAHSAIQKSASENDIMLVLDDGLLQECEFFLQIHTEELIAFLCKVLPETSLEKIAASKELCEELVQEEDKAYTILIENLNDGITQNAIRKIITLLTKEKEKFNEGLENQNSLETKGQSSSASKSSKCISRNDQEMIEDMGDTLSVTKQSDLLPVRLPNRTEETENNDGDASLSPENVQLSAGMSKVVKKKNPSGINAWSENPDLVVINSKIREINSKRWHPVMYCSPQDDGYSKSFEAAENTKRTSAFPALSDNLDLVVINSKVIEVRNKKWHDIRYYKPQDNHMSKSFRKSMKDNGSSDFKIQAKCKDLIPVLINSEIREVKNKKWHPVYYSRLPTDCSSKHSGSCNIIDPRIENLEKYIAELEAVLKQLKDKLWQLNRQKYNDTKPCEKHHSSASVVNPRSAARIAHDGLRILYKKGNKRRYPEWKNDFAEIKKAKEISSLISGSQELSVSKESKHDCDTNLNLLEMLVSEQIRNSEEGKFKQNPDLAGFSDTPTCKPKPLREPIYNACGNAEDGTSMGIDILENMHTDEDNIAKFDCSDSEMFHTASEFCSNSTYNTAVE